MIATKNPSKEPRGAVMKQRDSELRSNLLNVLSEPKGWVKTDIHIYKHGSGRVNFWHTLPESSNLDIISYYFTYNDHEIVIEADEKAIKIVKL